VKQAQVKELLLQSLEHERGGIKVYEMPVSRFMSSRTKRLS
jgi:hypothetical protein